LKVTVDIGDAVKQGILARKRKNKEAKSTDAVEEAGPSKPDEGALTQVSKEVSLEDSPYKKARVETKTLFKAAPPPSAPTVETPKVFDRIDLQTVNSQADLEAFEMDHVKAELTARGIKCGGTLQQRCERLWAVRGPPELTGDAIPEELRVGASKKKKANKK